jgi:diguanylate cyclase (GGDEF)-like protein/PAS domain S-box-containing protein
MGARIAGIWRRAIGRLPRARALRGLPPLAWVLLATCLAASVATGLILRSTAQQDAVRAFDVNATHIESNVATALGRVDDLAVGLASTLAAERTTNSELARYYAGLSAGGRDPGVLGFTFIRYVPPGHLRKFAATLRADPVPDEPRGPLRIFPGGRRPGYCLVQLEVAPGLKGVSISKLVPPGTTIDICAVPGGGVLAATRDSGRLNAVVITLAPHGHVLNVTVPVYGGLGAAPTTLAQRRARIIGWSLAQFSVGTVLGGGIRGSRDTSLTVSRRDLVYSRSVATDFGPLSTLASIGRPPPGSPVRRTFTLNLDGLWIVTVTGEPTWTGIAPATEEFAVFAAGALIGLLAFLVVSLLARNRAKTELELRTILRHSPAAIFVRDRAFRYLMTNHAFEEMMGLGIGTTVGRKAEDVLPADALMTMRRNEELVLAGGAVTQEETLGGAGAERTISVLRFPLVDEHGHAYAVCGIATDITERKRMENKLHYLADHDPLTGLYNRSRLIAELDHRLRYAARYKRDGAILTFDLDHLKLINDTDGPATGDALLKAVAEVLQSRTRETDTLARLAGDDFTVVLPEATVDEAAAFAEDVRQLLAGRNLAPTVTVSIGIATFSGGDKITADELLVCADVALYDAVSGGGDRSAIYTGKAGGSMTWVQLIRAALSENRFVLYGQPILDLRTGLVAKHELLIRMLAEDGDIIPPASFLPTAERFGLIHEIDRWVTAEALSLAMAPGGVAINLSGYSIGEQSIITAVRNAVADGLDPSKVIFEITETAAMTNIAAARQFAETLNQIGCNLALDDFGTGFGSFTYLKHIPARYLKIDMEFVSGMTSNETDKQIVKSIIEIAHSHNKLTIAEGVEDAETLAMLKSLGADFAQGFLLGKPKRLSPRTAFERDLHLTKLAPGRR